MVAGAAMFPFAASIRLCLPFNPQFQSPPVLQGRCVPLQNTKLDIIPRRTVSESFDSKLPLSVASRLLRGTTCLERGVPFGVAEGCSCGRSCQAGLISRADPEWPGSGCCPPAPRG